MEEAARLSRPSQIYLKNNRVPVGKTRFNDIHSTNGRKRKTLDSDGCNSETPTARRKRMNNDDSQVRRSTRSSTQSSTRYSNQVASCRKVVLSSKQLPRKEFIEFTKEERIEVWNKLVNYLEKGMKITNWGFCSGYFEIYYIMEKDLRLDEKSIVEDLRGFLQPALKERRIKLVELKCAPQYKATNGPGSKVAKMTDVDGMMSRMGSLGAFVGVPGKGTHVLLSGHDKHVGDALLVEKTKDSLGAVKVVLLGDSKQDESKSVDVALSQLPLLPPAFNVTNSIHQATNLVTLDTSIRPTPSIIIGDKVMKFANSGRYFERGKIHITGYNCPRRNPGDIDVKNCIAIIRSRGRNRGRMRNFHSEGESGTLATTLPNPSPDHLNQVQAIGMLTGVSTMNPKKRKSRKLSVGVPMETILHELSSDPYCSGRVEIL